MMGVSEVIAFWFEELEPRQWWAKDEALDADIRQRFHTIHSAANSGELWEWRATAVGRLAEIIVLDQFSRNIFRDTAQAFASDVMALVLAQEAVASGCDTALTFEQRSFLYMPYMHSESLSIHQQAEKLFKRLADESGNTGNYEFELRHKEIIEQFGRYPHRNAILGRPSSAEEKAFLQQPGSSF